MVAHNLAGQLNAAAVSFRKPPQWPALVFFRLQLSLEGSQRRPTLITLLLVVVLGVIIEINTVERAQTLAIRLA